MVNRYTSRGISITVEAEPHFLRGEREKSAQQYAVFVVKTASINSKVASLASPIKL